MAFEKIVWFFFLLELYHSVSFGLFTLSFSSWASFLIRLLLRQSQTVIFCYCFCFVFWVYSALILVAYFDFGGFFFLLIILLGLRNACRKEASFAKLLWSIDVADVL